MSAAFWMDRDDRLSQRYLCHSVVGSLFRSRINRQTYVQCFASTLTAASDSAVVAMIANTTDKINTSKRGEAVDRSKMYRELQAVATLLNQHDSLYYNNDYDSEVSPTIEPISDEEYDALATREAQLCEQYPDLWRQWQDESGLGSAGATRYQGRVGCIDVNNTNATAQPRLKRTHLRPMLSLDNVHNKGQLLAWLERVRKKLVAESIPTLTNITVLTEPKLDGLSLSLQYIRLDNSKDVDCTHIFGIEEAGDDAIIYSLQSASTRGDGRKGTDVTVAVREMQSLPLNFSINFNSATAPEILEVRGEIVLPQTAFRKIQQEQAAVADGDVSSNSTLTQFSNARNAASGILLRKEQLVPKTNGSLTESVELRSQLRFYAYDIVVAARDSTLITDGVQTRSLLQSSGFSVPEPSITTTLLLGEEKNVTQWTETDIRDMLHYHDALRVYREELNTAYLPARGESKRGSKKTVRSGLQWGDFDMDGCVHKISNGKFRTLLGTSNRAPRWAVAHKFPPTAVVTEIVDVEVQVGRTGALTPVAVLKPVDVDGVIVQRATMHNFPHMQQMLGRVDRVLKGSTVVVRRAGDVIPQVVSRVVSNPMRDEELLFMHGENSDDDYISLAMPSRCPACGSAIVVDNKNKNETSSGESVGQILRCGGPPLLCPPRAVAALQHAYSRDALDVTGLSDAKIQQLMDAGFLRMPSDVFAIANDAAKLLEIANLDGWGIKSVNNLASVAKQVANDGVTLRRFIFALGIRFVGVHSSAQIATLYGNVDAFLSDIEEAASLKSTTTTSDDEKGRETFFRLREDSEVTKGIGPVLLASLCDFASEKALVAAASHLAKCIKVLDESSQITNENSNDRIASTATKPLSGLSVVFTGSIADLSRSAAQKLAKDMGAKSTPSTVSKTTGMVVSGEGGGKKREQAEKLGVRILDADEFLQMAENFRK